MPSLRRKFTTLFAVQPVGAPYLVCFAQLFYKFLVLREVSILNYSSLV